jgi:hypothetical protein
MTVIKIISANSYFNYQDKLYEEIENLITHVQVLTMNIN